MENPFILELRGTGVILRSYFLKSEIVDKLLSLAKMYDEELPIAWFDPAFRWQPEVKEVLNDLKCVSEIRGLNIDGRSFLEIRQPRKKRRKFIMNELMDSGQLFPVVKTESFSPVVPRHGHNLLLEIIHGTGSLARYEVGNFNLDELSIGVFELPSNQTTALFISYFDLEMECLADDFLVRRQELILPSEYTNSLSLI